MASATSGTQPGKVVANATACATLVDEWIRCGVAHAVIAPGSRSTPLAVALAERPELQIHVVHDERSAAFVALGLGLDGTPAVLVCTSGTAAVNFHPAIVEAGLSDVAMIVCTADRPPELRGIGSPQTIDQVDLYGGSVKFFADVPVPDDADPGSWRPLAQHAFDLGRTGPVHLNLPFREPLVGASGPLPPPIPPIPPIPPSERELAPTVSSGLPTTLDCQRGVIVAGGRSGVDPSVIGNLAERLGWPVLADPTSGARHLPQAVTAFDSMLRHAEFARAHAPEVVVRFGRPPASKVLSQWLVASGAQVLQVGGPGTIDPDRNVAHICVLDDLAALTGAAGTTWAARWRHANQRAEQAIVDALRLHDPRVTATEPGTARLVAASVASSPGARLVVASSMPVRDLEWFGGADAAAHANRGANGIDGTISTALGLALSGCTTFVLLGDISFLHDSNALVAVMGRGVDLRVVVVDNGGGGIFSFLPPATQLSLERFEQLFGTPHRTDVEMLARAHGVRSATVSDHGSLVEHLTRTGPSVTRVRTDRSANVVDHERLNAAVVRSLR